MTWTKEPWGTNQPYLRTLGIYQTKDGRHERLPLWRQAAVSDLMQSGLNVPQHARSDERSG